MNPSDESLIRKCVAGESGAWDDFVRKYSVVIKQSIDITFRQFASGEWADDIGNDIFQDVVISLREKGCKRLQQFKGNNGCSLASWLAVVASRRVIDFLRKQKKQHFSIDDILASEQDSAVCGLVDKSPPPDQRLEHQAAIAFLYRELGRLPAADQLMIRLIFQDGLSTGSAAALVGLKPGAAYTKISRIRKKLKKLAQKKSFL